MAGIQRTGQDLDRTDVPDGTWTVSRLNEEIRSTLKDSSDRFPRYVVGEISEINPYGFGTFFTLRDLEEEAVISCLAWSHVVESLDHELEEGATAVVRASVDFYTDQGDCQLKVFDCWPVGESQRSREFEELRSALDEEGLLDEERKRPLPAFPSRVGVVTSLSGSAREDICTAIHERSPGTDVHLYGATVQGENAVTSLVSALQRAGSDPNVDTVVVTRGGGADADLWCFNEEPVVRAVADCPTPIVAAIGHEDDLTLTELVADRRAMTPTDAGVKTTPNIDAVRGDVADLERRVGSAYDGLVTEKLESAEERIERAHESLERAVATERTELMARRRRAADLEHRIETAYNGVVDTTLTDVDRRIRQARDSLVQTRREQRRRVETLERRVLRAYVRVVDDRLGALEDRLDSALADLQHATTTEEITARAARGRVVDIEARIDAGYEARVERDLDRLESRIDDAYRDLEADARVAAGAAEARRLRVVVAVLIALLLVGAVGVAIFLL